MFKIQLLIWISEQKFCNEIRRLIRTKMCNLYKCSTFHTINYNIVNIHLQNVK